MSSVHKAIMQAIDKTTLAIFFILCPCFLSEFLQTNQDVPSCCIYCRKYGCDTHMLIHNISGVKYKTVVHTEQQV